MKIFHTINLSVCSIASLIALTSCGKGGDSLSSENDNDFFKVGLKVYNAQDTSTRAYSNDFVLVGTYENCIGRSNGEEWTLSNSDSGSSLAVKKGNSDCKLKVTNFKTKPSPQSSELIYSTSPRHQLLDAFSPSSVAFSLPQGSNGVLNTIYSKMRILPSDFSSAPNVDVILSELKEIDVKNILKKNGEIFVLDKTALTVKQVQAPDFKMDANDMSVTIDSTNHRALYDGKVSFNCSNNCTSSYVIVKGENKTYSYAEIDKLYNDNSAQSAAKNFEIKAPLIRQSARLPETLNKGSVHYAKIIFAAQDADSQLRSYQVFTIEVENK